MSPETEVGSLRRREMRSSGSLVRRTSLAAAGLLVLVGVGSGAPAGALSVGSPASHPLGAARAIGAGPRASAAISADGRYVAFVSWPSATVPGKDFNRSEVFVRDRLAHVTRKVSMGRHGRAAKGSSYAPSISADGRFVVFVSDAHNLVPNDTNYSSDVFVRDLARHVTRRVSVGAHGRQGNSSTYQAQISADGRHVAFSSSSSNLVSKDTNGTCDVFVRDLTPQVTRRVSLSSTGREVNRCSKAPTISANGRFVAFVSSAVHLVVGDTNFTMDVFVRDRLRQVTRRVSVSTTGQEGHTQNYRASISADGRYVAMSTDSSLAAEDQDLNTDVYLRDVRNHVTLRVTASADAQPNLTDTWATAISAHGRYVTFASPASDLVVGDTNQEIDVFMWDRRTLVTDLVSVSTDGVQSDGKSVYPAISTDGRFVAFQTDATNLVPADVNGLTDVLVRDRAHSATYRVCCTNG